MLTATYVLYSPIDICVCALFQSEIKIYTNRLNSEDTVIPYEYTRLTVSEFMHNLCEIEINCDKFVVMY